MCPHCLSQYKDPLQEKCFPKYGCAVCVRSVRSEVHKQETIFMFFTHKITILLQTGSIL